MDDFDEAASVDVSSVYLTVTLRDGRCVHVPTPWFPRLVGATQAERDACVLIDGGTGIRWPTLDEVVTVAGLLRTV